MKYGEYQKERQELSDFISQKLNLNDKSLSINRIDHGNHQSQVNLKVVREINECQVTEAVVIFVELDIKIPPMTNIYSRSVIDSIKRCLDIDKLRVQVNRLYNE